MADEGSVDSLYLEPTDRAVRVSTAKPGGVEVRRIVIPEQADPDGPRAGYTIECPGCGQWTILGLQGRVKEERPGELTLEAPWQCPSKSCDVVVGIKDGRIDVYNPDREDGDGRG